MTVFSLKNQYPVKHLCQVLSVSRSSYYAWLNHKPTEKDKENEDLREMINFIYDKHKGIYGYRRITIYINTHTDKHVNHKRVYRLMKNDSLKAVIRRRRNIYIPCRSQYKRENILNRDFKANKPFKKLLTDITEFKISSGKKVYLSAIYDLYTKKIVSYKMSNTPNSILVLDTLKAILPIIKDNNTILHTDRGGPYKTLEYRSLLEENNVIHSMSRIGRCIDNGPMENFWGIIKSEMFYLKTYDNYESLCQDISEYIEFFNTKRISLAMKQGVNKKKLLKQ